MSELKKCPFCGGEARWATRDKHWIECAVCGTEGIYSEYSEDCIEAWNTRKPVERILERLEEAHNKSEECPKFEKAFRQVAFEEAIKIVKEEVG